MHNTTSPATGDESIEQAVQERASVAPRITPTDIERAIVSEHYFTARDGAVGAGYDESSDTDCPEALNLLTFCVLVLDNGFTVTGESACASPENFDADIGMRVARQKAVDKIWPLLGFRLRDRIVAAKIIGFDPAASRISGPHGTRID